MHASESATLSLDYGAPPALVAATSGTAAARARATLEAAGMHVAAALSIDEAGERLRRQASISALWVEVDADGGDIMDSLLAEVARDVADGRYPAVVATPAALIDPVAAALGDGAVHHVIDGDEAGRAAALAVAVAEAGRPLRLSDIATDRNAERLRQLSDEVGRIAATLARLSTGPAKVAPAVPPIEFTEPDAVPVDLVRSVIRARRLRSRYFSEELFADPAWDMLLDLFQAEISHLRVPVSSLCIAAAVPATTALRWLKTMVAQGIFLRRADPHDGRRVFVELAPDTSRAMRRYFADVGQVTVI